ncbi:MAG: hypothetical protein KKC03_09490 [Bacteroidetes bacterium]|nr:hypothetical protein [Bacteroidota bacterium]
MHELKNSLIEVRKAYRLLYDYQKKVLDLVQFIGSEYGRSYNGGYSKYCNVAPRNGKGSLDQWAWDWLNMYYYEFNFHDVENKSYFSVLLISDTGFYEAKNEDSKFNDKLELEKYTNAERSSTKLAFVYGDGIWECDGFLKNDCWEDPEFLLKNQGIFIKEDNLGKMVFKSYNLEEFSTKKNAINNLRDFSDYCNSNGINFRLKRDIEDI